MNTKDQPQALTERREPRNTGVLVTQSSLIGPTNQFSGFSFQSSNNPHSVELHIEELVLHGFDPANQYAIREAVERELTRLLTEQGSPMITQDFEVAHVNGGTINMKAGFSSEATGLQLARAIYGGLGK